MTNENATSGAHPEPVAVYLTDTGDAMVIEALTVTDPVVVAAATRWSDRHRARSGERAGAEADGPDLAAGTRMMLRVGATAMQATDHAVDTAHTDRLLAEFARRTATMGEDVERCSTDTVTQTRQAVTDLVGQVEQRITEASTTVRADFKQEIGTSLQSLSTQITRLFDGEDAVVGAKLDKLITNAETSLLEKVDRQAEQAADRTRRGLDLGDPNSPLSELKRALDDQQRIASENVTTRCQELSTKLDEVATAVAVERAVTRTNRVTPLKGASFAEAVHQHFDQIAAACGDSYTDTSTEVGLVSRSRKGDGVLRVLGAVAAEAAENDPPRIVVEMSDSDTVRRDWVSYLDEAERNRGAVASLGLVRRLEQLPGGERIRMFGPRRIVAVFDPDSDDPALLRVLVQMLRVQVILAQGRRGTEYVRTAEDKLREATEALGKLAEVQKTAGSIRKSADKIDVDCGGLHLALARLLREALEALAAATPDDSDGDGGGHGAAGQAA